MANNLSEIEKMLCEYNYFRECIILDIQMHDFGTTIEIHINNIWDDKKFVKSNIDEVSLVRIIFSSCQEFQLLNFLSKSMLQDMSKLNWGINEIASLHIEDAINHTSQYLNVPVRFLHAYLLWEGQRRIDIIFRDIKFTVG